AAGLASLSSRRTVAGSLPKGADRSAPGLVSLSNRRARSGSLLIPPDVADPRDTSLDLPPRLPLEDPAAPRPPAPVDWAMTGFANASGCVEFARFGNASAILAMEEPTNSSLGIVVSFLAISK